MAAPGTGSTERVDATAETWAWPRGSGLGTPHRPLHDGDVLPAETLQEYLKVAMALQYDEKPPYTLLRNSLEAVLQDLRVAAYDPMDLPMVP